MNVAAEKKNVTTTPYRDLVPTTIYRSCTYLQWEIKDNHGVVGEHAREGHRVEGYLTAGFLLTLVLVVKWSGFNLFSVGGKKKN